MKTLRTLTVGLFAWMLVAAFAAAAVASCAVQLPLTQSLAASSVVFTGTVVAVDGGDRIATVLVDEVWKGEPLPEQVEVRGGPGDPQSITSVDRSFARGDKYLFVPINDTPPFQDNACTATREYSPELESSRPLDGSEAADGRPAPGAGAPVAQPVPEPDEGPSQATKGLLFAVALGFALAVGYVLKRRAGAG